MDVKLPKLGEGAESGVVVTVFVKPGDTIAKDQPILELENEKAVASIPSPAAGTVGAVFIKPGDKVSVGQKLISLSEDGAPAPAASAPKSAAPAARFAPPVAAPAEPAEAEPMAELPPEEAAPAPGGPPPAASPTIRRLARDLGIDLNRLRGTGRGGRIELADLRAYIQRLQRLAAQAAAAPARKPRPAAELPDFAKWGPVTIKPLSPLRQTIARRMAESWEAVPRVTQFDEADLTRLNELRQAHQAAYAERGVKLTVTPLLLKALTGVLQKHPVFNSSLDETGENLVLKSYISLGIAVDTEAGLMVPVLRDADKKSVLELAREVEELARKARERKLAAEDMKGGTFTVSNQGGIGGGHFTPIINLPEVAILGVGRAAVKPVWRDGQVTGRPLLPLALSYDHRVIDGGSAARFITDLVRAIEQFEEHLVRL
jgi:pyruvate dehydrogenase E2 component (dihydrolipoamide acetyltransferase)